MINKNIVFNSKHIEDEYGTTTFYFTGPKELLSGKYPKADSMGISIEFPSDSIEARYAQVEFAPMINGEYSYSGWYDVDLPDDEIEELIKLAEKSIGPTIRDDYSILNEFGHMQQEMVEKGGSSFSKF